MLNAVVVAAAVMLLRAAWAAPAQFAEEDPGSNQAQSGAPWGLARLSHRHYTYNPDASVFYSDPNNAYNYDLPSLSGGPPTNVTVYMLDSGIDINHEQFQGRASWGTSFVDGEGFQDLNGHGTHLSGIAVGNTMGVARAAYVVAVKVLDSQLSGSVGHFSDAVDWVIDHHSKNSYSTHAVINYSAAGEISDTRAQAIARAIAAGIFVVTPAGNDNADACNYGPANTGGGRGGQAVVGALNYTNTPASFSNYGRCVDVFAPGVSIESSIPESTTSYGYMDGTSNAAAFVSGLVAYMWGLDPSLSLNDLSSLLSTANPSQVQGNYGGTTGSIIYNFSGQ